MKPHRLFLMFSVAAAVYWLTAVVTEAQGVESATAAATGVALTRRSPPAYPPLARQARITADVKLQVGVRRDGSVQSAELFSGHPLLAPAALDSARKSTFECRGCSAEVTWYPMTYRFGFYDEQGGCGRTEQVRSPGASIYGSVANNSTGRHIASRR
jgi:outer membrane biosynthesis protein TonB